MSARSRPIELTEDARQDYLSILLYTEREWGEIYRDTYADRLDRAISSIERFPRIGRARSDIGRRVRGYLVAQHIVLFRIDREAIRVLRIMHIRTDLKGLISEN